MIGATIAGVDSRAVEQIGRAFLPLGVAFQIQDDLLNLVAEKSEYAKDLWGDLWEGKHTLMLNSCPAVGRAGGPRPRS